MFRSGMRAIATVAGFVLGAMIGVGGAPAWEMAGLFVGFFAGIAGAGAASCFISSRRHVIVAGAISAICVGAITLLSLGNPVWVTLRAALLVGAASVAGGLLGFLLQATCARISQAPE